jgi:hypothetical protein
MTFIVHPNRREEKKTSKQLDAMASLTRARLWLALALALAASARAQSLIPTCPHLAVRVKSSKGKVKAGDKVLLTVDVVSTGTAVLDAVNVGLSSSMVTSWSSSLTDKMSAIVSGSNVFWLDQDLRPGKRASYQIKARVCSDADLGWQSIGSAMVYRLNATGGVACMTTADSNAVSQSGGNVQLVKCWQPRISERKRLWTSPLLPITSTTSRVRSSPQVNVVPSSGRKAANSPRCALEPPEQGAGYVTYQTSQRLVGATAVPLGGDRRRALSTTLDNSCYAACSYAGFVAPFLFETDPATGICYWCVWGMICPRSPTCVISHRGAVEYPHFNPHLSILDAPNPAARLATRCTRQGPSSTRP